MTELTVTFNTEVTAPVEAFAIRDRATNQEVNLALSTEVVNGKTAATLTFLSGPGVNDAAIGTNSLADGNYELVITGSMVSADGQSMSADYIFGDEATDQFFRLYGDSDGDGDVDGQDYGRFGLTYLQDPGSQSFNALFDFDADGDVDGQDYGQFGIRYLTTL